MASKNVTQVLIGGKIYTLSGYESEEYLQRVATYLNGKITEIKTLEGYARMTSEMKSLLLNLNTADDYFKLKAQADQLGEQISAKDRELYEIKHELITAQMRLEKIQREIDTARANEEAAVKRAAALESGRLAEQPDEKADQKDPVPQEEAEEAKEAPFPEGFLTEPEEGREADAAGGTQVLPAAEEKEEESPLPEGEEEIRLPDPFHDGGASYAQAQQMSLDLDGEQKLSEPRPMKSTPRKKRKRR